MAAASSGYLQGVASKALLDFAGEQNAVVRLKHRPGDFVTLDTPLLSVACYAADRSPGEQEQRRPNAHFTIDSQRSIDQQDVAFGLRQIVDIVLKSLSPGINDTTTAIMCIDRLRAMLAFLASRALHQPLRAADGQVRVIAHTRDFGDFVRLAFDQIRSCGDDNVVVLVRQLTALETGARRTGSYTRRQSLLKQCDLIEQATDTTITRAYEQAQVREFLAKPLLPGVPQVA